MPRKPRPRRLITRYAGTRLYDQETKAYVTKTDLRTFRTEGFIVLVRDAETGQYVTESVLAPERDA